MRQRLHTLSGFLSSLVVIASLLASGPVSALSDPAEVVRNTTLEVLDRVAKDREHLEQDREALFALVDEIILPNFDFNRMSRWVLGKYWRSASPDQQTQFVEEFKNLLVRTYANALFSYTGEEIDIQPVTAADDAKTVTVKTELVRGGSGSIPINYRMHVNDGRWKVFDVQVDGVSLVSTYRSSFAAEIRSSGIDGLIETLLAKNAAKES